MLAFHLWSSALHLPLSVLALAVAISAAEAQTGPTGPLELEREPPDRIAFTAHHALFDALGRVVQPSVEELEAWLARRLELRAGRSRR